MADDEQGGAGAILFVGLKRERIEVFGSMAVLPARASSATHEEALERIAAARPLRQFCSFPGGRDRPKRFSLYIAKMYPLRKGCDDLAVALDVLEDLGDDKD